MKIISGSVEAEMGESHVCDVCGSLALGGPKSQPMVSFETIDFDGAGLDVEGEYVIRICDMCLARLVFEETMT